jgi:hypothetical protein
MEPESRDVIALHLEIQAALSCRPRTVSGLLAADADTHTPPEY